MRLNARYSQHNKEKEGNEIKWIYLQNQNSFPKSFFHFQNLHKTYNILKKKIDPRTLNPLEVIQFEKREKFQV